MLDELLMDREFKNLGADAYAVLTKPTKVDRQRRELNSLPLAVWQQVWTGRDFSFCWNGALLCHQTVISRSGAFVLVLSCHPCKLIEAPNFWESNKKLAFF